MFILLVSALQCAADVDKSFILMQKGGGYGMQRWSYAGSGNELQESQIKEEWDKGKYITGAAYTEKGWFVVMSENPKYSAQAYNYTKTWPSDWIKEKYGQDYYITTVSCSAGKWLVVMSKIKGYTGQRYKQDSLTELKAWYDKCRDEGYYLTQATFSGGEWLWVVTKGTDIKNQGYRWAKPSNLSTVIKEIWDGGDRVHFVEYADGDYFIPYGEFKGDRQPAQSYKYTLNGLSEWISGQWDSGLALSYIGGGNPTSSSSSVSRPSTATTAGGNAAANSNGVTRTYRRNVTQYGYEDVTEYANGNKIVAVYGACQSCFGTQTCQLCYGQGGIITAGYGNYIACVHCGQTGKCPQCRALGGYTLHGSHLYGPDGREIYVGSVGVSSSSSSSPSSSSSRGTSSAGVCSRCHGTGVNPSRNSGGSLQSWVAYYNPSGTQCRYCGGYSEHYHDKCSSCNVPRY